MHIIALVHLGFLMAQAGGLIPTDSALRCRLALRLLDVVAKGKPSPLAVDCCQGTGGRRLVDVAYLKGGFDQPVFQDEDVRYLPDKYICRGDAFEILRPVHRRMKGRPDTVVSLVLREKADAIGFSVGVIGFPGSTHESELGLCGTARGLIRRGVEGRWRIEIEAPVVRVEEFKLDEEPKVPAVPTGKGTGRHSVRRETPR
jgi:hypothetical protein